MSKRLHDVGDIETPAKKRTRLGLIESAKLNVGPPFSHISKLSDEILLHIFGMLSLRQVITCQSVSHRWQQISRDPELWKHLYFTRFVEPRLAHVQSRTRTRNARRDWWSSEKTHKEGENWKDWKQLFKLRHNWHEGRCAIREIDITNSSYHNAESALTRQLSFWNEPVLAVPSPLVQFNGKNFVSVDKNAGLRAWDIGQMEDDKPKLVGSRRIQTYEEGWQLGEPTAVGIDGQGDMIDLAIGFDSGGVMILRLKPADRGKGQNFGFQVRFVLPPNERPEKILHLTYSHPYLLTLDYKHNLRAYLFNSTSFRLDPPHPLATLHAQALHGPCHLTLRKRKSDPEGKATASIAYSVPLIHGGWSVGVQEVLLDPTSPDGISQTRIGTCIPQTYQLGIHPDLNPSYVHSFSVPISSPTSISYSHPYLLTSHRDNTLTLYLVRSTDICITVGRPRRLWGHTAGVARAGIAGRGRAVSVSQVGGEVRVWELESVAAAAANTGPNIEDETAVGIAQSVRLKNGSIPTRVGKELYLDSVPSKSSAAVEWIGFDEEKVLVLTSDPQRDKCVTLYDFTF